VREFRPWQILVFERALEIDSDNRLCWLNVLLSTPRQVGKSVTLSLLAYWRLHHAHLFGEPQLVMHTGKDIAVCREVQRTARNYSKLQRRAYYVREANGQEEIEEVESGSRWLVRSRDAVWGYPASMGVVDECWGVAPTVVEDGIEPTMADREQPQLLLVSTANRRTTSIYPNRRAAVIEEFVNPGENFDPDTLILEWSAPPDADISDRRAWRAASPHWSDARERLLEAKLRRALLGQNDDPDEDDPIESFRAQYLNIWPTRRLALSADEALVNAEQWQALADLNAPVPQTPLVVGIEDYFGTGAAACASGLDHDGRVVVWGDLFASRSEAYAWAARLCEQRRDTRACVGATLAKDPALQAVGALEIIPCGLAQTRTALPRIRELVAFRALAHSDGLALNRQVHSCRVVTREGGLAIAARSGRSDLLRCMAWSVQTLLDAPSAVPFFVY
jgi:hypothetical protein